jgi:hypothetical protein
MSSLALYAAPVEMDNNNNNNGNSNTINNPIENKRVKRSNNKTVKNSNSKVETMKKQLELSGMDNDTLDMGDFKSPENQSELIQNHDGDVEPAFNENKRSEYGNYDIESFQNTPNLAAEEYYKEIVPNYNQNNTNNQNELSQKLDYLIHMLEEQRDQKTETVTEELILYSFLGVFIIFVLDSFVKVGKYTR